MVYINDKKYACESCIKGHRSSACRHNDRPLFEIKKKGRPVSQCESCRALRKTKRVHAKCVCNLAEDVDGDDEGSGYSNPPVKRKDPLVKPKRFVPTTPSLPNGLKDAVPPDSLRPSDPRQQVETLLNPCHCKDVWSCECRASGASGCSPALPRSVHSGLATLAQAAALCCGSVVDALSNAAPATKGRQTPTKASNKRARDGRRSPTPPATVADSKRHKGQTLHEHGRSSHSRSPSVRYPERGPDLPPLLASSHPALAAADLAASASSPAALPPPVFPSIPPLTAVASLAGTGCACGFQCACPGCLEHRGAEHASLDHSDCPDGCGTCVDHEGGLELPVARTSARTGKNAPSALERFFAQAAALPLPPVRRGHFDPADTRTYPSDLFAPGMDVQDAARRAAFGLSVALPKLECCGGRCGCPGDTCGCGQACDGCCAEHQGGEERAQEPMLEETVAVMPPKTSCCSA